MRAPRWALALTAAGTAGAAAMVLGLSGSALADASAPAVPDRYDINARGDAFYFEVNGDEIPASPTNNAGSLTADVVTSNTGGSRSFAGAPFYGNTVQTLPGTANGIPNQFGLGAFQIPFSQLPGYVQAQSSGEQKKSEEGGYYRVSAEALPESAKASGFYGAPVAIPAPNQQQTATATSEVKGDTVVGTAQGTSQGLVSGPLEIGHATAIASITKTVGQAPKIESKAFGQFSVNGMKFGFDQSGFQYAGQSMSSKDALAQANSALKNANIQLDLAPIQQVETAAGGTQYVIGGLQVTTVQASPSGAPGATFEIVYTIGRALVSANAASFSSGASAGTDSGKVSGGSEASTDASATDASVADTSATDAAKSGKTDSVVQSATGAGSVPSLDSFAPQGLTDAAAAVPSTVAEVTPSGELAPVTTGEVVAPVPAADAVQTLGLVASQQRGDNSELLYAMLVLAGVGVLGGHFLFTRFAVAARG